ncbi:MAG: M28 family peptidase [Bacteroidota bacterium]|nr:M28 family peptidase [Bacteroidota bacterium]
MQSYLYPSINVIAKVSGTDANLKSEYVLYSGHHDHDGVGAPINGDSIWNGADDNASVSVTMLAIGRAFAKQPAKRSVLFVWHGAEERGLLGSKWYAQHPTVPKNDIVAVINGDMIGRNNPDSAALLGVTKPHRNSMDLVNAAMQANEQTGRFKIDTTWDNTAHPEFWYFRSDHLPYAQAGIPAIFFTTLLHPDYHTVKDEADRIDYPKLTRMAQWMYATGWIVANAAKRPTVEASVTTAR